MRSIMIKSALIAATVAAGAFTATSASAFHPVGGFKGGFGHHFGHSGGHTRWSWLPGRESRNFTTVVIPCTNRGYVDPDGNPVVTKPCRPVR